MHNHSHQREIFTKTSPSLPQGYFAGDKSNPALAAFIATHLQERASKPSPAAPKAGAAFTDSIKVKRTTKIFNMHGYWSKKPHDAIRQYVLHHTRPGELVLDPFCGSGGTILSALLEGRKGIAIDLSPAASFFASTLCSAPPLDAFNATFAGILERLRKEYSWVYEWPHNNHTYDIHFAISSMKFKCSKCLNLVSLYRCDSDDDGARCPRSGCREHIKTNQEKFGFQLDEWHLAVGYGKHLVVKVDGAESDYEKSIQKRIAEALTKHRPPSLKFPKSGRTQVLTARGIDSIVKLYTPRNLLALCLYRDECLKVEDPRLRNALLFVLTGCCLKCSRMMGLNSDGIGRIQKNGLIVQLIVKDVNVFDFLEIAQKGLSEGFTAIEAERKAGPESVRFSTQSAANLTQIPDNSIDYVFTDPPYGERVQFWESNQVWEAWLGFNSNWDSQEVVVNRGRGLDQEHWTELFRRSMQECYRVLRPGNWITLTYNDRETWPILQDVMLGIGFQPDGSKSAIAMETTAKSEKQMKGEDNTIRDLVVNFRKPTAARPVQPPKPGNKLDFRENAQAVMREFLRNHPGSTKNRISDEVISRLVRKGQMEAHDFDALLSQVAEEVGGVWHLKEGEEGADEAEQLTADNAAEQIYAFMAKTSTTKLKATEPNFTQLEAQLAHKRSQLNAVDHGKSSESKPLLLKEIRELNQQLGKLKPQRAEWEMQAIPYGEIYEFYLYVRPKPRSTLSDLLEDYCYNTDEGNWRHPHTEAEKAEKSSNRQRAIRRKIQRLYNMLDRQEVIQESLRPETTTLAEWIRHCRRTGLYAQGVLLYKHGGLSLDQLSEEDQVTVQEDYDVCVRALARAAGNQTAKASKQQNMNL